MLAQLFLSQFDLSLPALHRRKTFHSLAVLFCKVAAFRMQGLPLARVVPLTEAAAAALLLGPDNAVVSAIGRLPVVHDLCSAAYAGIAPA